MTSSTSVPRARLLFASLERGESSVPNCFGGSPSKRKSCSATAAISSAWRGAREEPGDSVAKCLYRDLLPKKRVPGNDTFS